ncbi:hypothetical protein Tco_0691335 [Tanacetum coccineum]
MVLVDLSDPRAEKCQKNGKIDRGAGEHDISYIPSQILADFITEKPEEDSLVTDILLEEDILKPWTLFTDGSSCLEGSEDRLILTSPEGTKFTYTLRFEFKASNNETEYKAMIAELHIAEQMGVLRRENKNADALSKYTSFAHLIKQVLVEFLKDKSINEQEIFSMVEEEGYTWKTSLCDYLTEGTLPAEPKKARAVKIKSRQYAVIDGVLYEGCL